MTAQTPYRFAIVPIYADSTGREAVPPNAICHGSRSMIMERVLDSSTRRAALDLLNDAAIAYWDKERVNQLEARETGVKMREDAIRTRDDAHTIAMLTHAVKTLDALSARLDALEAELNKDPDEDVLSEPPTPPPGTGLPDDGDLQALKESPEEQPRAPIAVEDE
jgi:hypothetical protein